MGYDRLRASAKQATGTEDTERLSSRHLNGTATRVRARVHIVRRVESAARLDPRVEAVWAASVPRRGPWQPLVKRLVDLSGAAVGLLLLAPVFLVAAALVRLSSPGPIFFRQERLGRAGRPFTMLKFRTMRAGADQAVHKRYYEGLVAGTVAPQDGAFKLADDPRVTTVGRWLRRTSLDELPQLWNVLRSDMSLVGPRPPIGYEAELYGPREWRRLIVLPGMTGLWQVSGRSTLNFQQMVDLDLAYVERWSIWLDLQILLRTPLSLIRWDGH